MPPRLRSIWIYKLCSWRTPKNGLHQKKTKRVLGMPVALFFWMAETPNTSACVAQQFLHHRRGFFRPSDCSGKQRTACKLPTVSLFYTNNRSAASPIRCVGRHAGLHRNGCGKAVCKRRCEWQTARQTGLAGHFRATSRVWRAVCYFCATLAARSPATSRPAAPPPCSS